ncbi:MAG: formate--tetrahydrofolate ligase [Bacteroidales bacterium]
MKRDIQIAHEAAIQPVVSIGEKLGLKAKDLELYGDYKAKLPLHLAGDQGSLAKKLILVTAMTPTPAGEGKTTISIGLSMGLNRIGSKALVVLREPSLGPVFGVKGGAAGGGYSQVLPMEDINLHFTGDLSAVEKAHNLLAALIDNTLHHRNRSFYLDPHEIKWKRVVDVNDRSLRHITIGQGGKMQGVTRETGFDITAASEVMAILTLSRDLFDLKERLGNIFVGYTYEKEPVFARDLNAHGAMAAILKDAIKPNLVQTLEGDPAIIHGGPFANIATGTNTLIATKMALSLSDYVVTEAGFASELGAEKFLNIKAQYGGLMPNAVVVVATVRALKYHGGAKDMNKPNLRALKNGLPNLDKHMENMAFFNLAPVVAINRFHSDTEEELAIIKEHVEKKGVEASIVESFQKGSKGALELAEKVKNTAAACTTCFKPFYDFDWSIEKKVHTIAKKVYGAGGVEYSRKAKKDIEAINKLGFGNLPVCIAKTQNSLSDDKNLLGRPEGFTIHISDVELNAGAGFVVPVSGKIMRMPGLPKVPSAENIDVDENGNIKGLF